VSQLLFPLLILLDLDTEAKIDTVLVPDTEDSATSDDEVKSGSTVTESESEEELTGDWGSVKQRLQSEVRFISKSCLTYLTADSYTADYMDC
jgi:hypothetical protein